MDRRPNQGPPRHTAPLIARPQTSSSNLGSAIAGALGGMGWGVPAPPAPYWNGGLPGGHGSAAYGQQGGRMQHPLPAAPLASYGYAPAGAAPPPRGGAFDPRMGYPPQQNGAYYLPPPASTYPPRQQQFQPGPSFSAPSYPQQHNPSPQQQQYQYQSHPPYLNPNLPPRPSTQTTPEGYTISASYVPPPPPSTSNLPARLPSSRDSRLQRPREGAGSHPDRLKEGGRAPKGNTSTQSRGAPLPPPPPPPPALIKCSQEGCNFEGGRKAVREHEEDRHLIYAPGREPKPWVPTFKDTGARIEGTSISLDSPEAIARWIEDRKKRWPSKKVVEEKEQKREERVAAGLEAPPRTPGSRPRGGSERGSRGSRGRGRGGRGGWSERNQIQDDGERSAKRVKVDTKSDGSESDSDDDDDGPPVASSSKIPTKPLDGSLAEHDDGGTGFKPSQKESKVVCRYWRQGKCAQGESCPYLHVLPASAAVSSVPLPPKRKRPAPPAEPFNPFARGDPFAQLAERDVARTVAELGQVIDFLFKNDWLRGVERRVGELDEEGGVEVVGEGETDKELEMASCIEGNGVIAGKGTEAIVDDRIWDELVEEDDDEELGSDADGAELVDEGGEELDESWMGRDDEELEDDTLGSIVGDETGDSLLGDGIESEVSSTAVAEGTLQAVDSPTLICWCSHSKSEVRAASFGSLPRAPSFRPPVATRSPPETKRKELIPDVNGSQPNNRSNNSPSTSGYNSANSSQTNMGGDPYANYASAPQSQTGPSPPPYRAAGGYVPPSHGGVGYGSRVYAVQQAQFAVDPRGDPYAQAAAEPAGGSVGPQGNRDPYARSPAPEPPRHPQSNPNSSRTSQNVYNNDKPPMITDRYASPAPPPPPSFHTNASSASIASSSRTEQGQASSSSYYNPGPTTNNSYADWNAKNNQTSSSPSMSYGEQSQQTVMVDEEEEEVEGIKQQLRFVKQESLASTRNSIRMAREAEETARATLDRLGVQSDRVANTERSLDLAKAHNERAVDETKELVALNRSIFRPSFTFNKAAKRDKEELRILNRHNAEKADREETRREQYESRTRIEGTYKGMDRQATEAQDARSKARPRGAERGRFQFETTESDDEVEDEIDDNLEQLGDVAGRLRLLAMTAGKEVDEQNVKLGKLAGKVDNLDNQIHSSTARLHRVK